MRIKTITCHEVYNHGASLQEFALLAYLGLLGHEAETIHYKPDYLSSHHRLWRLVNPKFDLPVLKQLYLLAKLPGRLILLKQKKSFDRFSLKYIKTDILEYNTNEELKEKPPEADAYICGSDQIWNSYFLNGKDPAFYLDFVPEGKLKISYAASFAIDELEENNKPFVKKMVQAIDHVSVRELSGLNILAGLGINQAVLVLDPVFLIEKDFWRQAFVREIKEDFIFIYDFEGNLELKRMALYYAKINNCKIFTVNQNIRYADKNFWYEGPEMFLSLIFNSKFIISNSFHALAFSLIFEKEFLVFNRAEKINTRMRDLLQLVNLESKLVSTNTSIPEKIDYEKIRKILQQKIIESKAFLQNALKNGTNNKIET